MRGRKHLELASPPATMPPIVRCTPELYRFLCREERDPVTAETAENATAPRCNAWAWCMLGRGHVLAGAGLEPLWAGRASAWLMVSRECRPRELVQALRYSRSWLDARQRDPTFRRVEAYVLHGASYERGMTRCCGFELEAVMAKFDPLGRDYGLYARTR
jgi:hypothetical protein